MTAQPKVPDEAQQPVRNKRGGQPPVHPPPAEGGLTQSSTFIKQLNLVLEEIFKEMALDEG